MSALLYSLSEKERVANHEQGPVGHIHSLPPTGTPERVTTSLFARPFFLSPRFILSNQHDAVSFRLTFAFSVVSPSYSPAERGQPELVQGHSEGGAQVYGRKA